MAIWSPQTGGRRVRMIGLVVSVVFLLAACATSFRPAPEGPEDLLVLAAYRFEAGSGVASVLGKGYGFSDVVLVLRQPETGERLMVPRRTGGLLVGEDAVSGEFEIDEIQVSLAYEGHTYTKVDFTLGAGNRLVVLPGRVSNLGLFEFHPAGDNRIGLRWVPDFNHVRDKFRERHAESEWNAYDWENVRFR